MGSSGRSKEGSKRFHVLPFALGSLMTFGLLSAINRSPISSLTLAVGDGTVASSSTEPCNRNVTNNDFSLAYDQSFGLLDDIPSETWTRMKRRFASQLNFFYQKNFPMNSAHLPHHWYQLNFEPNFACQNEVRVGGMGDGPKWVCNPSGIKRQSEKRKADGGNGCLIYSIGSNGNFQFEKGVVNEIGPCEIHTFDFQDYTGKVPPELKSNIHFHSYGLKPSDQNANYVLPTINGEEEESHNLLNNQGGNAAVRVSSVPGQPTPADVSSKESSSLPEFYSLQEIVKKLGHEGRTIDIFKIDCEQCEWPTYVDWLDANVDINQIQVEVHEVPDNAPNFFMDLQKAGYVTFHKEPNILGCRGDCIEYAFLRLRPDFFEEYGYPKDANRKNLHGPAQTLEGSATSEVTGKLLGG